MSNPTDQPGPEPEPRGLERLKAEGQQQHPVAVRNVEDVLRLSEIFVRSGMVKDARTLSQAAVKILYGVELGFGPMAAMTGITMVDGSLSIGANLCAARVNMSPDHRYRVEENTAERCTLAFEAREEGAWTERGRVTWTIGDAETAQLTRKDNWRKYPRAMLFARAMTEGARIYCAELFGGVTVYTPEELGADGFSFEAVPTAEAGEPEPEPAPAPEPEPAAEASDGEALEGEVQQPEETTAPGPGDAAAELASWEASEPTPAQEAAALEAAGQEALVPREAEAAPAQPPVPERLDAELLEGITRPQEGSRAAGKAAARELGLRTRLQKVGGDELRMVSLLEALGLSDPWQLTDDRVFEAASAAVDAWCEWATRAKVAA